MNYIELFTQIVPKPIKSIEEKIRLLAEVDKLMEIPEEQLTQDQGDMLELLAILIADYEELTEVFKANPGYTVEV
jgi:antitoxin component HigA of HigAB toxin-antitoxin module